MYDILPRFPNAPLSKGSEESLKGFRTLSPSYYSVLYTYRCITPDPRIVSVYLKYLNHLWRILNIAKNKVVDRHFGSNQNWSKLSFSHVFTGIRLDSPWFGSQAGRWFSNTTYPGGHWNNPRNIWIIARAHVLHAHRLLTPRRSKNVHKRTVYAVVSRPIWRACCPASLGACDRHILEATF